MVVTELGIGYSTLLKWVKEFHKKLTSLSSWKRMVLVSCLFFY
jgi:hypothetical protein